MLTTLAYVFGYIAQVLKEKTENRHGWVIDIAAIFIGQLKNDDSVALYFLPLIRTSINANLYIYIYIFNHRSACE